LWTECGSQFSRSETSEQLVTDLLAFIERLHERGVTVYGGCSDAANVMKKTLKQIRVKMQSEGRVFLILMDFDHNHKNSRNVLMGRVLMTLEGVMFSILTIRALWLHTNMTISSYFKFLTLQHVAPKNKMLSELARTVHLAALRTLSCRCVDRHRPARVTSRHARMIQVVRLLLRCIPTFVGQLQGPRVVAALRKFLEEFMPDDTDDAFRAVVGVARDSIRELANCFELSHNADAAFRGNALTAAGIEHARRWCVSPPTEPHAPSQYYCAEACTHVAK